MPVTEDKTQVSLLKQGSSKAFEQLFIKYHKKLYQFCKKFIETSEEAENIVQSVFMEIWENHAGIDEEKSFSGYLFTIARNKIYNGIRKKINEKIYREYITGYDTDGEAEASDGLEVKQLSEMLDNLIESLPDRRKEIFLLSRNNGLTYREIAQQLNISENTVDTQIRNALDFLREELGKRWK
ncbi:MAG: RNA polymerase sigma-70 factor [Bacteroidales bacterium]|nr:RNA polymerase sigma-70 factor [Bacteroidales bacterium]